MSESPVLVKFLLDRDRPLRIRWLATDGVPGDGYKAQVTAIKLADGTRLAMDNSAILEQTAHDPTGGIASYLMSFNGLVGFASEHPDRARIDQLVDEDIEYELSFIKDNGSLAVEDRDYKILERPRGHAKKLPPKS
jgi:hypothetical protein